MLLFCGTNLCSVYFYKYLELNHLQKRVFIDHCYSLLVILLHFGAVGRMATRPVVLPEVFNGEGSWHQWIFHFENVAAVNEWNDDSCLCWMKVRLAEHRQHFRDSHKKSLQTIRGQRKLFRNDLSHLATERDIKPSSKHEEKGKKKDGPIFAEDLRMLADKGYPNQKKIKVPY